MKMIMTKQHFQHKQAGFVLILTLVMLAVLTLIGVSSMNSANIELKATANAKQHLEAFNATQSMLEYVVSKPATTAIDYQTRDKLITQKPAYTLTGFSNLSASIKYVDCDPSGNGGSLEDNRGFGYNHYDVVGTGFNSKGTATSNQTMGVRYPAASC